MSVRAWIETQITKHSITAATAEDVSRGNPAGATRLVDAAATLRGARGQVFGLDLPPEGVEDAEALADLCLRAVSAWAPVLDQDARDAIGAHLARVGLTPVIAGAPARERVGTLELMLAVTLEDEDGQEVDDATALAALDGIEAQSGANVIDLPCIAAATGGVKGWVLETGARLVYDRSAHQLRCELAFEVARPPSDEEITALARVAGSELLYSAWGLNLEWDLPDDAMPSVLVKEGVVAHRFEPAS